MALGGRNVILVIGEKVGIKGKLLVYSSIYLNTPLLTLLLNCTSWSRISFVTFLNKFVEIFIYCLWKLESHL